MAYLDDNGLLYFWQAIKTIIGGKVDKVSGKGLSTEDYTSAEKTKLSGIAAGAEVNVQPDWNETGTSSDAYIKNKPTIPTKTSDLTNDSGFLTSHQDISGKLDKIGGTMTGKLTLDGAPTSDLHAATKKYVDDSIPTKTSDLTNDGDGTAGSAFATEDYVDTNGGKINKIKVNNVEQPISNKTVDLYIPVGNFMRVGVDYVTAGQEDGTTLGTGATAEGTNVTASGDYSHAEGYYTSCSGDNSHSEGNSSSSSGENAHSEGNNTSASGDNSHSEGAGAEASGYTSHAEGYNTIAQRRSQHVFGEFNVADTTGADETAKGAYVEIVGKGTSNNARSNARTLDWSGNEVLAGKLTVGAAPTNNMDVTTKQYVDGAISSAVSGTTMFKGEVNSNTTISGSSYVTGWYWVVGTAGTYVGQTCEVGDMIFAIEDKGSSYSADDFTVVQANLNIVAITNAQIDDILAS